MNYITQLNAVMNKFSEDENLNPTHISLYLALFQFWNMNRFNNPISISRSEIMRLSKIGSRRTYQKCIKELHNWGYLEYLPSHNPYKGSKINMANFCPSSRQVVSQVPHQVVHQEVSPYINSINNTNSINNRERQKLFLPPTLDEVLIFFNDKCSPPLGELEGAKFFNYYTSNGWKVGGKSPMHDWNAAAQNWILKANEKPHGQKMPKLEESYLHVNQNKNYDEPL